MFRSADLRFGNKMREGEAECVDWCIDMIWPLGGSIKSCLCYQISKSYVQCAKWCLLAFPHVNNITGACCKFAMCHLLFYFSLLSLHQHGHDLFSQPSPHKVYG